MSTLTPDRQIEIQLDPDTSVQVEPYFAKHRDRFEIKRPTLTNVEQLASGVFILKPRESSLTQLHETTTGQASIMRLTGFNHNAAVQEIPLQRIHTDLPGVTAAPAVSSSGDHVFIKRIPAAGSFDVSLIESRPLSPTPTAPNYPMDVILQQKDGLEVADRGFILRWQHPGHGAEHIDNVLGLLFGGPLTTAGFGQFELIFTGDGRAFLAEWIDRGSGAAWERVDEWRYAAAELVPGSWHVCRIIPHAAKFIEFRTNIIERGRPGALFQNLRMHAFDGKSIALDAHVYEAKNRTNIPPKGGGAAHPMTGPGHIQVRVRQDLLLRGQVTRITYPASGTLRDRAFTVPHVNLSTHVLAFRQFSMVLVDPLTNQPHGSVTVAAYNASTGLALAPASENWSFNGRTYLLNGFALEGTPNAVEAELSLVNADGAGGPYSPWLFGYEAHKVGHQTTNGSTPLLINATHNRQSRCVRLNLTGPDFDPSHETGNLRIADFTDRCSILRLRGEGRIRITTTLGPGSDPAQTSVLFDGYWVKSEGRPRKMLGGPSSTNTWHDYGLTLLGLWKVLHERAYIANVAWSFAKDLDLTTPPKDGQDRPWKVTDAIRALLVWVGVPESQLDIPDLPIRLYGNTVDGKDVIQIQPGTNVSDFAQALAEDYLNHFLCFDANAGETGMWRLKPIPRGNESAVWTFTDVLPVQGHLSMHAGSYPANTSPIIRDSLIEWVVPPEGTSLQITGVVDGDVYAPPAADNPLAYNKPGASTADPTSPDYTDGRFRPIFRRHDPTLITREAVRFVLRRTFDIVCRAQRYARFMTPMPLLNAAALEPTLYTTHTHRPLMVGDVVSYRGNKAMITNCLAAAKRAHHQLAVVELRRFNADLPV